MTAYHITSHHTSHRSTWQHITSHRITSHSKTWHDMASRDMICCNQPHYLTSRHLTTNRIFVHLTSQTTTLLHLTSQPTTWHPPTSHHQHLGATETQPAATKTALPDETAEGWCIQKNSVWAARWLVTLHSFYKQILSLAYSDRRGFPRNFRPLLARELLVLKIW